VVATHTWQELVRGADFLASNEVTWLLRGFAATNNTAGDWFRTTSSHSGRCAKTVGQQGSGSAYLVGKRIVAFGEELWRRFASS
jgi:hypothetical protein